MAEAEFNVIDAVTVAEDAMAMDKLAADAEDSMDHDELVDAEDADDAMDRDEADTCLLSEFTLGRCGGYQFTCRCKHQGG